MTAPGYIVCNQNSTFFYQRLFSIKELRPTEVEFFSNLSELSSALSSVPQPMFVGVELSLDWDGGKLQEFAGIDLAAALRRDFRLRSPIGFFSLVEPQYFQRRGINDRFNLLNAQGSFLLTLPSVAGDVSELIATAQPLNERELADVVLTCCDIKEKWHVLLHQLAGHLSAPLANQPLIETILEDLSSSIGTFAPEQKENLQAVRNLLHGSSDFKARAELMGAVEKLDERLQNVPVRHGLFEMGTHAQAPPYPPKGFSKILIADDEPQSFLINSLRAQYGYQVVEQAFKLSQARDLFDRERPDIVLSDLFFKQSSRPTEVPSKTVGDRFIQYALTRHNDTHLEPGKPLVLVTSKAVLRSETEIRAGAINCSGANRATNPAFIHNVIWAAARERGVSDYNPQAAGNLRFEHLWRLRLQQYYLDLPRVADKWRHFAKTIAETIHLCKSLANSQAIEEATLINRIIATLEPYVAETDFSISTVEKIFVETRQIRDSAQQSNTLGARELLNILHGRIEQFPSVLSAVQSLLSTYKEVAQEMVLDSKFRQTGFTLRREFEKFSDSQPLLPFLASQMHILKRVLSDLPKVPKATPPADRKRVIGTAVRITVVEDDDFWRDFISSAIAKVKARLGDAFNITAEYFDNAEEALNSLPATSKSFAIAGSRQKKQHIVVADICLPEDRAHAERIRASVVAGTAKLESPHSIHGFNLIQRLSAHDYEIPLIVLSTVNSISDRSAVSSLGVSDSDFLAKGIDNEDSLVRALVRKIEKKNKYIIRRVHDERGGTKLTLNGIEIPLSKELAKTIFALLDLHQTTGKDAFSISDIIEVRGDSKSDQSKKSIHDHISRIRKSIRNTLRRNGIYVNARDLIRTQRLREHEEFTYRIDGEITSLDEESDYEHDLELYRTATCKVLIVENDLHAQDELATALEHLGYEIAVADNVVDAVRIASDFQPHIVSLDLQIPHDLTESNPGDLFAGLEAWKRIRVTLTNSIGIVVPTVNADKQALVAQAAQSEIPLRNFISKQDPNWLNVFLKKIADEKQRIFLGEIADIVTDIAQPIIEIVDGSNLTGGILKLIVNGKRFSMRSSPIARILGALLKSPGTLLSLSQIKHASGSTKAVTKNDQKNWTRRIRAIIKEDWIEASESQDLKGLAERILKSSANGIQLNVQVLDLRSQSSNPSDAT